MNEHYDIQALNDYLLGSLPGAEAERFDELSFTDDEFIESLKAAETDLVDAYIHNELKGTTLEEFNSYYLASPLRREKVEFAKAFQIYAGKNVAAAVETHSTEKSKQKKGLAEFFSPLNIFNKRNSLLQWSFSAAVLVFLLAGGFWIFSNRFGSPGNQPENQIAQQNTPAPNVQDSPPFENRNAENFNVETAAVDNRNEQLPPKTEPARKPKANDAPARLPKPETAPAPPRTAVALFLAPSLRSTGQLSTLTVPEQTDSINTQLQLEADDYKTYRVALTNASGDATLWRSGTLKTKTTGANKVLNFRLPAKLLKSKIYSFVVSGVNSNGEAEIVSNYSFRSVVK